VILCCRYSYTCDTVLQVDSYTCECEEGFEGLRCEVNINECYSLPCENHGICADLINAFLCHCAPGYDGVTCQHNIDECMSEPCLNKVPQLLITMFIMSK